MRGAPGVSGVRRPGGPPVVSGGQCGAALAELEPPGMWITAKGRVGSVAYRAPGRNRTGVVPRIGPTSQGGLSLTWKESRGSQHS
ncbi:hypothetical protein GCM10010383_45210 [Streptomyces lomondensis]|uniref:Uncharacterized protein n=1 Tax=Streptomyces lomondensis TaxID=68229 RepID=A0ABQ2XCI7_9ACTN|nr:hypothetical protein GCM10010383_45210 [Streptomyces lomondensis]